MALAVTDLFPDADKGLRALSEKASAILTDAAKVRGTYSDAAEQLIAEGTAPVAENFNTFLVQSGSIMILFGPSRVAPSSEGAQRVSVPMSALR
jgi:hypothetical protein